MPVAPALLIGAAAAAAVAGETLSSNAELLAHLRAQKWCGVVADT